MSIQVRVETKSAVAGEPGERFSGVLVLSAFAPITDCMLIDAARTQGRRSYVARLRKYPCWTEPLLALLTRLIHCSQPSFLTDCPSELPGCISLNSEDGRVFESLSIVPRQTGTEAVLVSRERRVVTWVPPPEPGASLRETVLDALLWSFGWHQHPPPFPAPLTEVPIRRRGAARVVDLKDIPPYLRAGLAHHLGLVAGTIPASIWLQFLEATDEGGSPRA